MVRAYARGNEIYFNKNQWRYIEDDTILDDSKPCVRCGKTPTKDGYDACLGYIDNVISACCGHGKESPYVVYKK